MIICGSEGQYVFLPRLIYFLFHSPVQETEIYAPPSSPLRMPERLEEKQSYFICTDIERKTIKEKSKKALLFLTSLLMHK